MNYDTAMRLVEALNRRFAQAGMKPWYQWSTAEPLPWGKLVRWANALGLTKQIG